jgi:hypothetical protein
MNFQTEKEIGMKKEIGIENRIGIEKSNEKSPHLWTENVAFPSLRARKELFSC